MVKCPNCGGSHVLKVIYFGLPGKLCESCSSLWGMAAFAPPVSSETEHGPQFAFLVYEGRYWRALWHWFRGE